MGRWRTPWPGLARAFWSLERGEAIPREPENWNPEAVWKDLRYRTQERWLDERGREFRPYTHYCVGGNTKFWGSVLYRFRREDFQATEHVDGLSPAWPIDYDTLAPYYDQAERLYQVHGECGHDPTEPPRGPVSASAGSARARHDRAGRRDSRAGAASVAVAARVDQSRGAGRLRSVPHVQLVSVSNRSQERRRGVLRSSRRRATRT